MGQKLELSVYDDAGTGIDIGCMGPFMAFPKAFQLEGVIISAEETRGPMGAHKRDHIFMIMQMPSVQQKWREAHGRNSTEEDVDRIFKNFIPLQEACLEEYVELIPGTLETIQYCRSLGQKIGVSTGYVENMIRINREASAKRGYLPDTTVGADGTVAIRNGNSYDYFKVPGMPKGRPEPWMIQINMMYNRVFGPHKVVKIGDTIPDIQEGLNAEVWTIGLPLTGNELGLDEEMFKALKGKNIQEYIKSELDPNIRRNAYDRMKRAGAHFIVDGIWDVPPIIDKINWLLQKGIGPSRLQTFSDGQGYLVP